MKKKIILLVIIAVSMTTRIFAKPIDGNVNGQVNTSFSIKFTGAREVNWSKTDLYMKADFVMDERHLSAYFLKPVSF